MPPRQVLPESQTKQTLVNYIAISTLPEGMCGTGTKPLGGIDAVVKPGWLYQITVSEDYGMVTTALVKTARQDGGGNFRACSLSGFFVQCFHPMLEMTDSQKAQGCQQRLHRRGKENSIIHVGARRFASD